MLRIEGFAAPYRQKNSFNETFATCAFAGKLKPCPMLVMHEDCKWAGDWDDVWQDHAGIWVRGRLHPGLEPYADELHRDFPQMSVSWTAINGNPKSRAWREKMDLIDEPVVIGPGDTFGIAEVSLVDRGAFAGTHWRIIRS